MGRYKTGGDRFWIVLAPKHDFWELSVPYRRINQESHNTAFHFLMIPLVVILVLMTGSVARALEVTVSYSFPEVGEWAPPPAEIVEGSIIAIFQGDEPMEPLPGDVTPERIDDSTWSFRFNWDWIVPVSITFMDGGGQMVTIEAAPQPVIPFGSQSHDLMTFHITTEKSGLWSPATGIYVYGDHANFQQHLVCPNDLIQLIC